MRAERNKKNWEGLRKRAGEGKPWLKILYTSVVLLAGVVNQAPLCGQVLASNKIIIITITIIIIIITIINIKSLNCWGRQTLAPP